MLFQVIAISSIAQNCKILPAHFYSYEQAISWVKNASFKIKEDVNTSKSSWIRSASYYSCDGKVGYFIFSTDSKEYIHEGIPVEIWNKFKNADSFGSYYDHYIRKKYRFYL
ncbi:MAG TPA: KTSC domain-containing protein [Chitinophagaceae bacterium]|nr:KTSC domain-containing protein [Chitinophagaceae bacterium]